MSCLFESRWLGFHLQGSASPGSKVVIYTHCTRGLGPQYHYRCSGSAATATPLQNEYDARPAPRPAACHRSTSPFRSSNAQRAGPWVSLTTVGCNGSRQLHRLACYRPLSWIPTLSPRSCVTQIVRAGGLHEILPHRNRPWGSPGVFSNVPGLGWTEAERVDGQGCGRSGQFYDSDIFPTEARGSLAVPAVACRSGRSVAVAKTDRLRSNQFQQGTSEQPAA